MSQELSMLHSEQCRYFEEGSYIEAQPKSSSSKANVDEVTRKEIAESIDRYSELTFSRPQINDNPSYQTIRAR